MVGEKDILRTIIEIYASLYAEAEREKAEAAACITSRNVDTEGAALHRQKYHGWRRAASRVQDICLAHGINVKSEE